MTQPAMDATPLSDGMIECYVVNFLACIAAFNEPPAEAYTIQALRAYAEALKRLRPTPSEQPGEDVEALITLVREKDRLWHDQGIECDHDEWLANAILAAGYRRQAPAPENEHERVDHRGLAPGVICVALACTWPTCSCQRVGDKSPPVSPETPPSDACREKAATFCEWAYSDHNLDWSNDVEDKLAALLQSMVMLPSRDRVVLAIHEWQRDKASPAARAALYPDTRESLADAILSHLNGRGAG